MYSFQLHKPITSNFIQEIKVNETDKIAYSINTDFKVILEILAIQERNDVSQLAKNIKTLSLFYGDDIPPKFAFEMMSAFISRQKPPENPLYAEAPVMDFLIDSDVIYTSVLMQYNIDLLNTDMHWYKFLMLVNGLNEHTPLYERIRIRTADLTHLKGMELKKAKIAREKVALPVKAEKDIENTQQKILGVFGMR